MFCHANKSTNYNQNYESLSDEYVYEMCTCVAQWGKALGYRSDDHALEPCHRSYTLCIAG